MHRRSPTTPSRMGPVCVSALLVALVAAGTLAEACSPSSSPPAPAAAAACLSGPPHAGMADLPPLLQFANGTAVPSPSAFLSERKAEMRQLLSQYYYGFFPETTPPLLSAVLQQNASRSGRGHYDLFYTLTFGVGRRCAAEGRGVGPVLRPCEAVCVCSWVEFLCLCSCPCVCACVCVCVSV